MNNITIQIKHSKTIVCLFWLELIFGTLSFVGNDSFYTPWHRFGQFFTEFLGDVSIPRNLQPVDEIL